MKLKEGISTDVTDARWISGYLLEIIHLSLFQWLPTPHRMKNDIDHLAIHDDKVSATFPPLV